MEKCVGTPIIYTTNNSPVCWKKRKQSWHPNFSWKQRVHSCCQHQAGGTTGVIFGVLLASREVRGQQRLVPVIRRSDGLIVKSTKDNTWRLEGLLFTTVLLATSGGWRTRAFLSSLERKLFGSESELCEGHLAEDECLRAVKQMASSKAPEVDGLLAEFYVVPAKIEQLMENVKVHAKRIAISSVIKRYDSR